MSAHMKTHMDTWGTEKDKVKCNMVWEWRQYDLGTENKNTEKHT